MRFPRTTRKGLGRPFVNNKITNNFIPIFSFSSLFPFNTDMAPEVLENDGYSKAADVYSFGVMMHEIYTGKEPYSEFGFKKPWRIIQHLSTLFSFSFFP